jgi:hypothetical protein
MHPPRVGAALTQSVRKGAERMQSEPWEWRSATVEQGRAAVRAV